MLSQISGLLLAYLVYSSHGSPLESAQHDLKNFLSTRIIGGVDAPPQYGRHMAALVFGSTFLICGGSIVTNKHIITAAHCIDPMIIWGQQQLIPSFRAVVGSHKWESAEKDIEFTGYHNHPEWNYMTIKNDIGVLFLAEDIIKKYGHHDNVVIIPLDFSWVGGGVRAHVNGWGRVRSMPNTLQLLYVNVISSRRCVEQIREISGDWMSPPYHDPRIEICTFHSIGHGMCHGDSGSALVREDTQKLIGLVSWGFPCAVGAPDMYVRNSAFEGFLRIWLGLGPR